MDQRFCHDVGSRPLMVWSWVSPLLPEGAPLVLYRRGTAVCTTDGQDSNSMLWLGFPVSLLLALWPFTARWRGSLNLIAKFDPRGV